MPKQLTFIHAADLHLGAPFRGLQALSDVWAKKLISAIPESYGRVIDAAINNKVDFVLIAGDIFDSAKASYADYRCFFEGLNRLNQEGIHVYLCTGNHDPFTSWQQDFFAFPLNTTMLPADKPGFVIFEKEGEPLALIGGRGYYSQAWPEDVSIAEGIDRNTGEEATGVKPPFAIGLLHTGLNLDHEKAPTDPAQLLRTGMNYWALGHIHLKYFYPKENPQLVFSGCIQGRDVKETGERGVYKVTLTEGLPNQLEFIPTASIVWQRMEIDITNCKTLSDVSDKIMQEMFHENSKSLCEEMCVRITLVGKTELHKVLGKPGVLQDMRKNINDSYPVFFCDTLIDKTVQPLDKTALMKEGLFPAVFMQASAALQADKDEEIGFLQGEFLKKNLPLPRICEKDVSLIAEEAENLILDLLTRDDER